MGFTWKEFRICVRATLAFAGGYKLGERYKLWEFEKRYARSIDSEAWELGYQLSSRRYDKTRNILGALVALALLAPTSAWAVCTTPITVKDAAAVTQTFCVGGGSGAMLNQNQIVDTTGANILGVNASGQLTISNSTFAATQGTSPWVVSAASLPLPSGAATQTTLAAILSAIGTPIQTTGGTIQLVAGGALIGGVNTFQGGVAVATGNALFVQPGTAATFPISAATLPLPTGAATAAGLTNGSQKTQVVDSLGNVVATTSNNLNVQCANCTGSGVSSVDTASYTFASSLFAGGGGFFQTVPTNNSLTTGQQGMFQLTANRALFTNLRNAAGAEVGTAGTPLQVNGANGTFPATQATAANLNATVVGTGTFAVQDATTETNTGTIAGAISASRMQTNVTGWAGGTLGAMVNYGTSPGAVLSPSVNAFVTNTPSVSGSGVFQVGPTTSANTAANPFFHALSIGGAINSATNPIFSQLSDGTRTGTIKAASTASVVGDTALVVQLSPNQPSLPNGLTVIPPANQSMNITQVGGSAVTTSATGEMKVGVVGSVGTVLDGAPGTMAPAALAVQGVTGMVPIASTPAQPTASLLKETAFVNDGSGNAITSTTGALDVNIKSGGAIAQGSTTAGQQGQLIFGAVTAAAPSYTTTQSNPLSLDLAGNLRINCILGCSSSGGTGITDEAAFTPATTALTLGGGFFQTTATSNALTTGQGGAFQVTANRALFTNLRNAAGAEVATAAVPLQVSLANTAANATPVLTSGSGVFQVGPTGAANTAGNPFFVNPGTTAVFPVTTSPTGATTTQTGSSIATQNTFQSAATSNSSRKGATVQNTSAADILYVFFGANGSATKAASFQVPASGTISATTQNGIVLTDNIAVTCADATPANCTYVVAIQ